MYIFRWLMKHPIIILALYFVGIVAILLSMTSGDKADPKTVVTDTVVKVDLSEAPIIEPSILTSALVDGKATNQKADTNPLDDAGNGEVVDGEKLSEEITDEPVETKVTAEEVMDTEADSKVEDETKLVETTEVIADETQNVKTKGSDTQFSESDPDELLVMAREAYWNNGLEESAEIYQQLIKLNPDVIDYKGELGNVFWRQGFPEKAAELYAEISFPMIDAGSADRVANMVGFIGLFYPEKATEIHDKLQAGK